MTIRALASDYSKQYGLFRNWFSRNKQWAVDQDYVHKLSPEEARWLDRFNREYHAGDIRKGDPKAIHKTDEHRRDCYYRNNKQNRDLLSVKAVAGKIVTEVQIQEPSGGEEVVVSQIDRLRVPRQSPLSEYAVRFAMTFHEALISICL